MYLILKIRLYIYLLKIHVDQLKNHSDLITNHSDLLIFHTQIAEKLPKITQNNSILFIEDTAIAMN